MMSNSPSAMTSRALGLPQRRRRAVEHGVHVLVPVRGAEALAEIDRFVDHDAIRHIDAMRELEDADHHDRSLDGIELIERAVDEPTEQLLYLRLAADDARYHFV